ncbi:MAG: hypothetical protein DWQ47_13280 [Acidobacteria bacterium]|nr:MAG: hypothetical protein DWQ32_00680 [Acidobacteriota bacterium]REK02949.1 MAG: hypothetical protein DWQ38_11455 [Acidobacteriota bacterium]REK13247.1 MAG: hypothetical protein DWQ43_06370 [Acidobacteriota bacterium]REK41241.1 MAG: hypothetical protein DWQ47_13280 [Acidobacteriota bacterium]
MKRIRELTKDSRKNVAIVTTLFLVVVLGCMGGGGPTCTGELVINGKTYNGIDDNEAEAKRNTCAKYCIEGDPEMDGMYRIWLDSLPEDKKERVMKKDLKDRKWEALYESDRIEEYVKTCEKRCLDSRKVPVKCEG